MAEREEFRKRLAGNEYNCLINQLRGNGEGGPLRQFKSMVWEIIKQHPEGVSVKQITEELGYSANLSKQEGGSIPDNSVYWQVAGYVDFLFRKKRGGPCPILHEFVGNKEDNAEFSFSKYRKNPNFPDNILLE